MEINEVDNIVMKILHYFITERDYTPVVVQGLKDEIWLENMKEDYKIIRIVSKHIHNNEQLNFDHYRAKRIGKSIKKQTFSFSLNILSIYTDLGENAEIKDTKNMTSVYVNNEEGVNSLAKVDRNFPNILEKLDFKNEKGETPFEMFFRLTNDIEKKSVKEAKKANEIFKKKTPYITYVILAINIFIFFACNLFGVHEKVLDLYCLHGPSVRNGEFYRLFTSMFLHADIIHILLNSYALYVIGMEVESYMGKFKYIIIYLISGLFGNLLSISLGQYASVGASGAIFGLMGALLYFGYHYRAYLGQTLRSQIIPLIVVNLTYGFIVTGIDNFAHIGGLVGGVLTTACVGVADKETKTEQINGFIITTILFIFLMYLGIFAER